ncbi:MAG: hypothetical protein R3C25_10300 [Hyphomonadaceae bacterium]
MTPEMLAGAIGTAPYVLSVFSLVVLFGLSAWLLHTITDEKRLQIWMIAIGAAFAALAIIFSTLSRSPDLMTTVFTTVVGIAIPLFLFYMRSTNLHLSQLTRAEEAFERDERLDIKVRTAWAPVMRHLFARAPVLNTIAGRADWSGEVQRIFLRLLARKVKNNLANLEAERIFLRRDLFSDLWAPLTEASDKYLSVCDLSPYANASVRQTEFAERDWDERIAFEIEHLTTNCTRLRHFDKIIVYEERVARDIVDLGQSSPPACATATGCIGNLCQYRSCLVNKVVRKWAEAAPDLRARGIHGHGLGPTPRTPSGMIWLVRRRDFGRAFAYALRREHDKITTMDIGLFGDTIVGEEFKLLTETFYVPEPDIDTRTSGAETEWVQSPGTLRYEPDRPMDDFLYVMRSNPDLSRRLTTEITRHSDRISFVA